MPCKVLLGVLPDSNMAGLTRHEARFGITSFIYRARRPFHPGRLNDLLLEPYFVFNFLEEDDEEGEKEESETEESKKMKLLRLQETQKEAQGKQKRRAVAMGEMLRSKGFIWIASSHNIIGGWQQAGNIIRLEAESPWMCEMRSVWEGTPSEELVNKDLKQSNGEDWPHGDRRQELVFIGQSLKHDAIQTILDQCLLNDEEMMAGPEKWEETMAAEDKIQLSLDEDDEEEEEGEEEDEEEDDEHSSGSDKVSSEKSADGSPTKKMKKDNSSI